jgi:hypothetical protein
MQTTINVKKAAEFATFDDASIAASVFEYRHGIDTRINSTADGYVVEAIDEEGDAYGWLEEGTIDITSREMEMFKRD